MVNRLVCRGRRKTSKSGERPADMNPGKPKWTFQRLQNSWKLIQNFNITEFAKIVNGLDTRSLRGRWDAKEPVGRVCCGRSDHVHIMGFDCMKPTLSY